MEIALYDAALLDGIVDRYNDLVRGLPHCYPVSADEFAEELAALGDESADARGRHSEAAFVAVDDGAVCGFAHVGVERPRRDGDAEQGIIRLFWYERGQRQVGHALLDAAEGYLRERGMTQATAFHQNHRYRFYHLSHACLSDRIGHVHALLGLRGYERWTGEVYLDWPNFQPAEPPTAEVEAAVAVAEQPGRGARPGLVLLARQAGEEIGVCSCKSCGEWSDAADAQDWFLTEWLGIEGPWQGKGLGKHLLQLALNEMHARGYRHAAISTNWRNHRAALFYSNFGYRVSDWTYAMRKGI